MVGKGITASNQLKTCPQAVPALLCSARPRPRPRPRLTFLPRLATSRLTWKQPNEGGRHCTIPHAQPSSSSIPPADLSDVGLERLFGVGAPGNATFSADIIHGTDASGHTLYDNKGVVLEAIKEAGATEQEQAIVLAIAMLETTYMSGWDSGTANTSCLNLNPQMLKDTYDGNLSDSDILDLRKPENLATAVKYLLKWVRGDATSQRNGHGLGSGRSTEDALNYIRGGPSAFVTAPAPGGVAFWSIKLNVWIHTTADYRNAIATIYAKLRGDAGNWNDGTGLPEAGNLYHNNVRISIYVEAV